MSTHKKRLVVGDWQLVLPMALSLCLLCNSALAQQPTADTSRTARSWPIDSLGRRTPRGTVEGFIDAVAKENYIRAARYLNTDTPPTNRPDSTGINQARALQRLLDVKGSLIARALISNDSTGQARDAIGPNQDLVGTVIIDGKSVNVVVERITGTVNGPIWLFSAQTVSRIPALVQDPTNFSLNRILPAFLISNKWGGVPVGHWLAMILLAMLAYGLMSAGTALIIKLLPIVWAKARHEQTAQVIQAFALPVRLYLTMLLFVMANRAIGVSIIVRQSFSEFTVIISLVAFLLLLWRLIDVIAWYARQWLVQTGQPGRLSVILFMRRGIKLILIALGIIAILNIFGWDVTTGLAALGIGGIALALGAQKTIEDFIGSVTIIADQPLRVGDYCAFDGTSGTIEQIGMRSTLLRTLERTAVVIPNGKLAALKIENYAFRDRMLFNPVLHLRYETTPDQMRYLLAQLSTLLQNQPSVNPDPARVRFVDMAEHSLDVEIFAYIDTPNFSEFLKIKEELMLRIMDIIAEAGISVALPSRTLYMGNDTRISEEKTRQAEERVKAWRDQNAKPDVPPG